MRILRALSRIWTIALGVTALGLMLALAARFVLPLAPWLERPTLVALSPAASVADVVPRSSISLRFSRPMNRRSVEEALRINPPTLGKLAWDPAATTLTFRPRTTLTAATTYTVSLAPRALGRWWQPLDPPAPASFRTARLPSVVAALPAGRAVAAASPLALVFSQAMVGPERLDQPLDLPLLSIEPPLPIEPRWLDDRTLLISPREPLRPATTYTATLALGLSDLRGIEVEQPVQWAWSTAWPTLLSLSPSDGARRVGPRDPLAFTLASSLPIEQIRAALTISPNLPGTLDASTTITGTQLITFTPDLAWGANQLYSVSLAAGDQPLAWRFSTAPEPGIVSLFPGQGQVLPPGQALRLRFSTPMDADSLQAALSIEPPVGPIELEFDAAEVRLTPALAPSSSYTLTIAASARDRNGTPLGSDYQLRLRTAAALPALSALAALDRVISLPVSQTASLELEYVNLSALDLALYQLDGPTLVRLLNFSEREWAGFRPERYGQPVQQQWRVALSDPPDQLVRASLPISRTDSPPLAAGAYYLRVSTSQGPRADLLLLVTPLNLVLKQHNDEAIVWAVDQRGRPAANMPVALYSGNAALIEGRTDDQGLYRVTLPRSAARAPLTIIADNVAGVVRQGWALGAAVAVAPSYASLLFSERTSYQPGAQVIVRGLARRQNEDGAAALPAAGAACRLLLSRIGEPPSANSTTCTISPATGVVSASLTLDPALPVGAYLLRTQVGDSFTDLPIQVAPAEQPLDLSLAASPTSPNELLIQARAAGEPLIGALARWQLRLDPLPAPPGPEGFSFAAPASFPVTLSQGETNIGIGGQASIALPSIVTRTLAYALEVAVSEPGGEQGFSLISGRVEALGARVGLRLPVQALSSADRPLIELLALDGQGQPLANAAITIAVYRGTAPRSGPTLERRATSDSQGRADIELVQLNPGRYRVVASLGSAQSEALLYVARPGFVGWENAVGEVELVAERQSYQPGDTARLLVTAPTTRTMALLSIERGNGIETRLVSLSAGSFITISVTPDMAPVSRIGLVLADGMGLLSGATRLPVTTLPRPLLGSLMSNTASAPAGASVPLSFTIDTTATVLIAMQPADSPQPAADLASALRSGYQPTVASARSRLPTDNLASPGPAEQPAALRREPATIVLGPQQVLPGEPLLLRAPLPATAGRWRFIAYAVAGAERFLQSSVVISSMEPLELTPLLPSLLRPGDRAIVALDLQSSAAETQSLTLNLAAVGAQVAFSTPTQRQLLLAPGQRQRLAWEISASPATTVTLRFSASDGSGERGAASASLASLASSVPTSTQQIGPGTVALTQHYRDPLSGLPLDPASLRRGQLVNVQATLVVARSLEAITVTMALPGALHPIRPLPNLGFTAAAPFAMRNGLLRFSAPALAPGIYQVGYLARVGTSGDYAAPPPQISLASGESLFARLTQRVVVQ